MVVGVLLGTWGAWTRQQLFSLYLFNTVLQFCAISSIPKIKRDSCNLVALKALRTQGCGSRKEGQLLDLTGMGRRAVYSDSWCSVEVLKVKWLLTRSSLQGVGVCEKEGLGKWGRGEVDGKKGAGAEQSACVKGLRARGMLSDLCWCPALLGRWAL